MTNTPEGRQEITEVLDNSANPKANYLKDRLSTLHQLSADHFRSLRAGITLTGMQGLISIGSFLASNYYFTHPQEESNLTKAALLLGGGVTTG